MNIAVPTTDNTGLEAEVAARFGRAPYFAIVDEKLETVEFIANTGQQAASGAGIQAAQLIADQEVDVLIAGNLGPKAFSGLERADIKLYQVDGGTVKQAVTNYQTGKLVELEGATKQSHAGLN